jgi:hypothetical protein
MSVAAVSAAGAMVAIASVPLLAHGVAYARAAAAKRRARSACPFDDDDHDTLPWPRAVQLVVAESVLWWHAMLTAARRVPRPDASTSTAPPVLLLPPPGLPRSSVLPLARRLAADGVQVTVARWSSLARSRAARVRTLDRALRAMWDTTGARLVDVIAPGGAAAIAAAHLARGGSGMPAVRRLLVVGAPASSDTIPPGSDVIALCSYDDPFLGPVERARWPGAVTVAIRGFGRLGLLHAPYVYGLLREHLLASSAPGAAAWNSAAS